MRSWYSETYVCLPPLNECLPLLLAGRFDRSSILDDILTVCDVLNINYQVPGIDNQLSGNKGIDNHSTLAYVPRKIQMFSMRQ
jgi:hypothetical protein